MKQVLHIFQKDARHHWPEIVFSVVVLVGQSWAETRSWSVRDNWEGEPSPQILLALLVLSWTLLMVRVIHSETLPGDRQFWITRPYEWPKLLAAKVLFAVLFINFPLFIAQLFLLREAGFRPVSPYIPDLLWMHIVLGAFLVLPMIALGTVTSGMGQAGFAALAAGLFAVVVAYLAQMMPEQSFSTGADGLVGRILIIACVITVVWQFARRQTAWARLLLVGSAALIAFVVAASPYRALIANRYPHLGGGNKPPVELSLDPAEKPPPLVGPDMSREVLILIPLLVNNVPASSRVAVDGMMLSIESKNGTHWNSGWRPANEMLFPDQKGLQIGFAVDKNFFENIQGATVNARISFAMTVWRDNGQSQVATNAGDFPVRGVGVCSIRLYSTAIYCRYPVRRPPLVIAETGLGVVPCDGRYIEPLLPDKPARGWSAASAEDPIDPIGSFNFGLSKFVGLADRGSRISICPGTPLRFSTPEAVGHMNLDLNLDGLRIADYRLGNVVRME